MSDWGLQVKSLLHNRFVRNVTVVASGTAGAQLITLVFAPVITRIYGPEAFGLLGVFSATVQVLVPLAALSYPNSIVLPDKDHHALGLIKLCLFVGVLTATVLSLALLGGGEALAKLLGIQGLGWTLYLLPLVVLFIAGHQTMMQWLIRTKRFAVKARTMVIHAAVINLTKVGAGIFYPLAAVLIAVTAFSHVLLALMLYRGNRKQLQATHQQSKLEKPISKRQLARQYSDFPFYRAPQVTLFALSQSMPVIVLMTFFGPAAAGFFTLARQIISMPAALISQSVGDVFYPRITEAARSREPLHNLIRKATLALAAVGFIPFAVVIAVGPPLFALILGSEWWTAGEYARWLSIWMFFAFLNNPAVRSLPILKAQRFHLIYTIFTIALQLTVLLAVQWVFASDVVAIAGLSIVGAAINIVLILVVLNKSRRFDNQHQGREQHV